MAVIWCIIWLNWVALVSACSRARARLSARYAPAGAPAREFVSWEAVYDFMRPTVAARTSCCSFHAALAAAVAALHSSMAPFM